MGADIHLYIEYKNEDGYWVLDENQKCKNCASLTAEEMDECIICFGDGYIDEDIGRSYELFGVLANVRNDYDLKVIPIANPRGIPLDSSLEYIRIATSDPGDHSHSFVTLKELKEHEGGFYLDVYFDDLNKRRLLKLAKKFNGDENVRIVFFFDN